MRIYELVYELAHSFSTGISTAFIQASNLLFTSKSDFIKCAEPIVSWTQNHRSLDDNTSCCCPGQFTIDVSYKEAQLVLISIIYDFRCCIKNHIFETWSILDYRCNPT